MQSSVLLALMFALVAPLARGQERFGFVIPGDDAAPTVTDFSKLTTRAAGDDGFVRIQDGHMVTDSGRLRIWGFNTCFGANFPAHEDAQKVAAHLAKLGVNGMRIHHHDTAPAPRGIWVRAPENGRRALDPEQVEKLDFYLDQLNRRGIYVNLNLHVGRGLTAEEGFENVKDLPYAVRYAKYLLYFEPRMRQLTKDFCREYLTHFNTYRQRKRTEDPGIAMIEITNENSFSKLGPGLAAALPEPYRNQFVKQWNVWLRARYADDDAIKRAWAGKNEPLGAVLADTSAWKESLGAWKLRHAADCPVIPHFIENGPEEGVRAVKFEIRGKARASNEQELQFPNVGVEPGKLYTISFWVKADAVQSLHVDVSLAGPDNWNSVGFREVIEVPLRWQRITRVFRSADKIPGKTRICFKFGGVGANFSLADVKLQRGGEYTVIPPGQSLGAGNIDIPVAGWSEAAQADVHQFMVDVETDFIRDLTSYLKKELGVRVPITASQITYHGAPIVANTCDYTDIHAYWQHPRFPRKPWDSVDWTIANTPMERVPESDALLSRTPWRLHDRPFTISEWNIPDPNDYAASVVPFAAMVASLQDWDGVFFFQYQSGEGDWYADKVQRYFSFNGQPAKLALFSACANLYRRGDLAPLEQVAASPVGELLPSTLAMSHRIGMDPKVRSMPKIEPATEKRYSSADGNVVWDATKREAAHVSVNTPKSRAVWGLVGGQQFHLGKMLIRVGQVERDYAAIVVTSLDGQAIESSKRLLLAAVGSAQNRGMAWNDARTSVGNQWGSGPTQVNGVAAQVQLPYAECRVHALDGIGHRMREVKVESTGEVSTFSISPELQTLWYEIHRP